MQHSTEEVTLCQLVDSYEMKNKNVKNHVTQVTTFNLVNTLYEDRILWMGGVLARVMSRERHFWPSHCPNVKKKKGKKRKIMQIETALVNTILMPMH